MALSRAARHDGDPTLPREQLTDGLPVGRVGWVPVLVRSAGSGVRPWGLRLAAVVEVPLTGCQVRLVSSSRPGLGT